MSKRISDSELLFLIAQGNLEAKKILDKRYIGYCKAITKKFLENHPDYGYSFEDFFNAAMVGYLKARNKFDYEISDGFYPYCKIWVESEQKDLLEEGNKFFLNENPHKFLPLDLPYKDPDENLILSETYGTMDEAIVNDIRANEILSLITSSKYGLDEKEISCCAAIILTHNEKEARASLNISYPTYRKTIASIKEKIGDLLLDILK